MQASISFCTFNAHRVLFSTINRLFSSAGGLHLSPSSYTDNMFLKYILERLMGLDLIIISLFVFVM